MADITATIGDKADITVHIGTDPEEEAPLGTAGFEPPEPAEPKSQAQISLQIRKTLDGSFAITDHPDIDVVIMPHMLKIVTFPKEEYGDHIYAAQSRLFNFLAKKGIIVLDSIIGGNLHGSLEANLPPPFTEDIDPVEVALYVISKFVDEELPHYSKEKQYEDEFDKWLLEPDDENSTDLEWAAKTHQQRKGVQNRWPGSTAAYGLTGMYRA